MADSDQRMADLRDSTDRDDHWQVTIEVASAREEEHRESEIENAGDLNLTRMERWLRRHMLVELSRRGNLHEPKEEVGDREKLTAEL